jgi:hypothetical protein
MIAVANRWQIIFPESLFAVRSLDFIKGSFFPVQRAEMKI